MFRLDIDKWEEIMQAITRNKSRSILTAFGIFWGIFMLVFLMGGGKGLKALMSANFAGFAQNSCFLVAQNTSKSYKGFNKGRQWDLVNTDIDRIQQSVSEIGTVTPLLARWGVATAYKTKTGTASTLKAMYPNYANIENPHIAYGRFINQTDIEQHRRVCVIGTKIRDELFPELKNPVGKSIRVDGIYYQVVGLTETTTKLSVMGPAERSVIIPFTTMQQLYNMGNKVLVIGFTVKEGYTVTEVLPKVQAILCKEHLISPDDSKAILVINMEQLFKMVDNLFRGINILIWLIGIGTLVSGAIGVSNIMMVTVNERTIEIGIRRAIGAKPKSILFQIMSESIVLTIFAGLFGICFASLILYIVETAAASSSSAGASFQISFSAAVLSALLLTVLGALAGLAPAFRAISIKPIEAIRDE